MSKSYYCDIDVAPVEQESLSVGMPDPDRYVRAAHAYGHTLIRQIRRTMNVPPGVKLSVRGHPHEYGTYYEVRASCDPQDDQARAAVDEIESNGPDNWDKLALYELAWHEQRANVLDDPTAPQPVRVHFMTVDTPPEVPAELAELALARIFEQLPLPLHEFVATGTITRSDGRGMPMRMAA